MRGDRSGWRAIKGPIILITLGILFALQSFNIYGFDQTWPVLLIVIGLLSLVGRSAPAPPPSAPPPNYNWQQPPTVNWQQPSAGYRGTPYSQSPYTQPTAGNPAPDANSGPAKGGFGSSAPPRENPPAGSNPGGSV